VFECLCMFHVVLTGGIGQSMPLSRSDYVYDIHTCNASSAVYTQVAEAEVTEKQIDETRELYRPVVRACMIV